MKNKKGENFSEWYTEITQSAELCDLRGDIKGIIVNMPWAVMIIKKMYALYEAELEKRGHFPALFPAVVPESRLKLEAEHVEGFEAQVFWITETGHGPLEERYALRPTSETIMYPMYALWIRGLKDLPLKIYQSCQVWRYETKATRPFIRGREFWWIEAHNAFATLKEAEQQIKEDMEITETIMHQQFGIPYIFFQRPEWDKFPGAVHTYAADTLMPDGKILQQPSTHLLGQKFAKVFGIMYTDENDQKQYVWQTTYGPCIWRILASLIAQHGDDKGLVLPFALAPFHIVIVPIYTKENEATIRNKCLGIRKSLDAAGYRTLLDWSEKTPGNKFYHWEMRGVPVRIEIGEKEASSTKATLCRRDTGTREQVEEGMLVARVGQITDEMLKNIVRKADQWFATQFKDAKTIEEVKRENEKGGFIRIPFCSIDMDGKECADKLKAETTADVRGTPFGKEETPPTGAKCIVCGKPANHIVYVGKQY
jgi:prolyl-tRNA synthetase